MSEVFRLRAFGLKAFYFCVLIWAAQSLIVPDLVEPTAFIANVLAAVWNVMMIVSLRRVRQEEFASVGLPHAAFSKRQLIVFHTLLGFGFLAVAAMLLREMSL